MEQEHKSPRGIHQDHRPDRKVRNQQARKRRQLIRKAWHPRMPRVPRRKSGKPLANCCLCTASSPPTGQEMCNTKPQHTGNKSPPCGSSEVNSSAIPVSTADQKEASPEQQSSKPSRDNTLMSSSCRKTEKKNRRYAG
ncbi:hypothetical protein NDU88_005675 [Pleurodeles waltl]|uniref:Uncharacterized protein n=1 Tax=Pleurodeles waltl TaxID=8319 RepID=A0AAV7WVE0_PLEWA|nr:hypothetical protein NDU88_005675 [Pleurodeles waltl]